MRIVGVAVLMAVVAGCGSGSDEASNFAPAAESDSAFVELQQRGAAEHAMGVDQYTSTHKFDDFEDGGRIQLVRDMDDPEGAAQIQSHLRHIAQAFSEGDFDIPMFVHDREVPGTRVMAELRDEIEYEYSELPRGAEVRIRTENPEALAAIHEFLAFQRADHRAGGHEGH